MKRWSLPMALVALGACSRTAAPPAKPVAPPVAAAPVAQVAPPPVVKPAAPPVVDPASPAAVLARVHAVDQQELALAQLAKTHAHSKAVKSLAAALALARTKEDAQVVALAKKLSAPLADPQQLNLPAQDKTELQALAKELDAPKSQSAAAFDQSFLAAIDDADRREALLLTSASGKASSPELKSFETAGAASVQKEQKTAERDLKSVAPHASRKG